MCVVNRRFNTSRGKMLSCGSNSNLSCFHFLTVLISSPVLMRYITFSPSSRTLVTHSAYHLLFFRIQHRIWAVDQCFDLEQTEYIFSQIFNHHHSNFGKHRSERYVSWTNLKNLARLSLFSAFHVFGREANIFDNNGTVVGKDLSDFSSFALVCLYFFCFQCLSWNGKT